MQYAQTSLLMDWGPRIDAFSSSALQNEETALMLATQNGHIGTVAKLVALGADVHKADKVSRRIQSIYNLSTRTVRAVAPILELSTNEWVSKCCWVFLSADDGQILQYM